MTTGLLASAGLISAVRPMTDIRAHPLPDGPPSALAAQGELRAVLQLPRLLLAAPRLATAPRSDGGVVIDIPGWLAPEAAGAPLRAYLRWLGYDARGWGFGKNAGDPERDAERLAQHVVSLFDATGDPVALVGWSLGGVIAREVAREHPEAVRCVVTYGTPVVGGPTYTRGAHTVDPKERARITALVEQLDADRPISVPVTAMVTRRDGVVSWTACLDRTSPQAEHVEVRSTHVGMGVDPDVWLTVARALSKHGSAQGASGAG